ncbi:MAG: hypothetical protein QM723_19605 [Myxococcaceae bacterium]
MSDERPAPRFPSVKGRLAPRLFPCPGCGGHLYPTAKTCPHCKGKLTTLRRQQVQRLKKAAKAVETLKRIFGVD